LAQKELIYNAEPENKINWKDSSLALLGSDLERKSKPQLFATRISERAGQL
jgi:hypothetical protein